MADEQTHRDGEIISVSAEGSAVRVESWLNGEPHIHVFDREGYSDKDGTYHPPGNDPPALPDLKSPDRYEGEILSAYVTENGDIRVNQFIDGDVRGYGQSEERATHYEEERITHSATEPALQADQPQVAADGSPVPTEVIHVREDGVIVAREPGEDGEIRTHYYDTEPVGHPVPPAPTEIEITPVNELDAWIHNAARDGEPEVHTAAPIADVAPTEIMSVRTESDGHQVEVWHLDDGRTRVVDYEVVPPPPPPVPTAVDLDATADVAQHGTGAGVIDGSAVHDAWHDAPSGAHADAAAAPHATDSQVDDPSHGTTSSGE